MYAKSQLKKGAKGSVQFKTTKGRLQIVFSYPVEENGEIAKLHNFGIMAAFDDLWQNENRAFQKDCGIIELLATKPRSFVITRLRARSEPSTN